MPQHFRLRSGRGR
ncbi:hypothetical protein YPPY11_2349, partial [Yersinia pestis PY-11]